MDSVNKIHVPRDVSGSAWFFFAKCISDRLTHGREAENTPIKSLIVVMDVIILPFPFNQKV